MSSKPPKQPDDPLRTKETFILSLKEGGDEGWWAFYDKYASLIVGFARSRGCDPNQAEDVLQETVLALYRHMATFDYDRDRGKFRSLIFRVALSKIGDVFRKARRRTNLAHSIQNEKTKSSLYQIDERKWREEWDAEWDRQIMSEAIDEVRGRVKSKTFESFKNVFLDGKSVKETAKKMGIPANTVSQHKHKVMNMITDVAKQLRSLYGD